MTPNTVSPGATACAQPASKAKISDSRVLDTVGPAQQGKWMRLDGAGFAHPLANVARRDRAVGTDVGGARFGHHAEYRAADLHRVLVVLGLHAPGAVMAGAALHRGHLGAGNRLEQLARLLPHVLHARMARDVIRDLAERLLEVGLEQAVFLAQ